ncbi:hypothetical protein pb186bvf_007339 [Paramecium bursaria]
MAMKLLEAKENCRNSDKRTVKYVMDKRMVDNRTFQNMSDMLIILITLLYIYPFLQLEGQINKFRLYSTNMIKLHLCFNGNNVIFGLLNVF